MDGSTTLAWLREARHARKNAGAGVCVSVMDLESFLLLAGAATGLVGGITATVVGILHVYGWLPQRYLDRLSLAQQGVAKEIGGELRAVFAEQEAKVAEAMKQQMEEAKDAEAQIANSANMSIVRSIGVDKQQRLRVDRLLGDAILGPAMPLLRQFAPGLADALEENPALLDVVVQNPLFIKYVRPRLEQYLGNVGTNSEPASTGWGT